MRILICLRNHILAEGVKNIIQENLVGATLADYHSTSALSDPELVIFDSQEVIEELKQNYARAKFICIDMGMKSSELAGLLYYHGINGVISTNLDVDMFCKAIRTVHKGQIWLEQEHLKILIHEGRSLSNQGGVKSLSHQDRSIIRMVCTGLRNQAIADHLFLSLPTVKAHLSRIYKTLNIENRSQLVALATECGWPPHENLADKSMKP